MLPRAEAKQTHKRPSQGSRVLLVVFGARILNINIFLTLPVLWEYNA